VKIGIFDSGLGGLLITRSLISHLPSYDYVYLGDTARVPYGNRSQEIITRFTEEGVRYLLDHNSRLVIVACNTASSEALRFIQQKVVPRLYPGAKVLGVLIPAAEAAVDVTKTKRIGVLATSGTVASNAFMREITKLLPQADVIQQPAPLLVPLLEYNGKKWVKPILKNYLAPLLEENIDTLILGCTHYPLVKDMVREMCGSKITVISQDEIIPDKLADYLIRHPEMSQVLTQNRSREFYLTDLTPHANELAKELFKESILFKKVNIERVW
jgi:glutamate racemase